MIYWISCIWHFKMDLRYSIILQSILRFPFVLFPQVCLSSHYEVLTAEWVILYENILRQHSDIVKVSNFLHSKGSVGVVAWGTDGLMIKTRNYSSLGLSVERGAAQMDWAEPSIGIYCRRIRARDKPMGNIYHCIQHTLILQWDPLWWVKSVVHGLDAIFIN